MLLIIIKFLLSFHLWIHLKSGIASTFLIKVRRRNVLHVYNRYSCWGNIFEVLRMGLSLSFRIIYYNNQ